MAKYHDALQQQDLPFHVALTEKILRLAATLARVCYVGATGGVPGTSPLTSRAGFGTEPDRGEQFNRRCVTLLLVGAWTRSK
jgi:hypothetical protein